MSKRTTNKIDRFDCEGEAFIWNNDRTEIVGTITREMSNTSRMMDSKDERVSCYYVEFTDEDGKIIKSEEFKVNGKFASFGSNWKVTDGFENSRKALSAAKAWAKNPVEEAPVQEETTEEAPVEEAPVVETTEENEMKFEKTHNITHADETKDIAKAIRLDIKAAKKAGLLPLDMTVSVRSGLSTHSAKIDVTITGLSGPHFNPEFVEWYAKNPHVSFADAPTRYSAQVTEAMDLIKEIVESYNWDQSGDEPDDYFSKNFMFTRVDVCGEIDQALTVIVDARREQLAEEARREEMAELGVDMDSGDIDPTPEALAVANAEADLRAAERAVEAAREVLAAARIRAHAAELLAQAEALRYEAGRLITEAHEMAGLN